MSWRKVIYATAMLLMFYGGLFVPILFAYLSTQGAGVLVGVIGSVAIYMSIEMYQHRPWR